MSVHSPQPTSLAFHYKIRWHRRVCDGQLNGWLQHSAGTQFVGTHLSVDTTQVLPVGGSLPPKGAAGEMPEFGFKPPLGAPLLIFPRGYLLRCFPQDSRCLISVFPLLCELLIAIDPHLPVSQLFRGHPGLSK